MSGSKSVPNYLSETDHTRIAAAVAQAELLSSGEIVTILAERSDGYTDVAMAWSGLVAFLALTALAIAPGFYTGLYDRLLADWGHVWTPRALFTLAAVIAAIKFLGAMALQLWPPLKFWLVPAPIRTRRVHEHALRAFRIGAEQRTAGRTGILVYLSMRERRAEIVADVAISAKVDPAVWGEAMRVLVAELKHGRIADGLVAAIDNVGAILALHVPRAPDDTNELPDRLIEV